MGKGKALDEIVKQQIIYLWMNKNCTQIDVARRLGIGKTTVARTIREYTETGAHQPPEHMDIPKPTKKPGIINPEFDAAVNEMIAEVKAEKAEQDKLPGVVCRAIDAGFHDLADEIDKRRNRIEELEAEIAEFEKDIAALRKWREAHK